MEIHFIKIIGIGFNIIYGIPNSLIFNRTFTSAGKSITMNTIFTSSKRTEL
ncbi:hypothetical protein SA2149_03585 [Aggregatibacter actinomycetemcomitans serotype e str. SA2149]|nr:hypothetical protein SA2149_03585 [Aggregatibacter actinomycetemcomitans serotype e str. SA2149]